MKLARSIRDFMPGYCINSTRENVCLVASISIAPPPWEKKYFLCGHKIFPIIFGLFVSFGLWRHFPSFLFLPSLSFKVCGFVHCSSELFDFNLFAGDANLFYENKSLQILQNRINSELIIVHVWLSATKLSLNIEKSNFIIFHPPQKRLQDFSFNLSINNKQLKREYCIKYLGIMIDSHLSWKPQVDFVVKKIRRSIGILSKLRHYVDLSILLKLYYALIYPFLIYGIIIWGNTYESTLKPIFILQKKALRIITFSQYDSPSPLFKSLQVIKFYDLVTFHIATFMYKFHNQLLPTAFHSFFIKVTNIHKYNTRLAAN